MFAVLCGAEGDGSVVLFSIRFCFLYEDRELLRSHARCRVPCCGWLRAVASEAWASPSNTRDMRQYLRKLLWDLARSLDRCNLTPWVPKETRWLSPLHSKELKHP